MNNKAHLRPKDYDSNGDIIPMACKEEKGDLISREALKDAIEQIAQDYVDDNFFWAKLFDLIDNAPTVEPFERIGSICEENCGYRPQGEWKPKTDIDGFTYCVCSSCNWLNYGDELNFCPNCGADMRGGAE